MSKVHYLNSHLDKYREKNKITVDVEKIEQAEFDRKFMEDPE